MSDWRDNYRFVEAVKERATGRTGEVVELKPEDVVVKIERNDGAEDYYDGFRDYHGPR